MSPQLSKIVVVPSEDQNIKKMVTDMELQKLHGTIKALHMVVSDTGVVLSKRGSTSTTVRGRKEADRGAEAEEDPGQRRQRCDK